MLNIAPEQFWDKIVNTMMDGLMVVDIKGTILFVNKALEYISGYSKEELLGRSCQILECDTCFDAVKKGGTKYCALFSEQRVMKCRCTLRRKDGEHIYVLKNAVILKDNNGNLIGGVETFTDLRDVIAKEKEIARLRQELAQKDGFEGIIGNHPSMQIVYEFIARAAESDAPVIIYGETGTGKELIASAIHRLSPRRDGPYIRVNCAALNEQLLESELFGHVRGAFTGADRNRIGRFEAANGGSIFLDEVGDIPLSTQVKLLRVLQEKEIERVGDHRPIPIDVRIIAATNKDLPSLIERGLFREDFYYRIAVLPIRVPPLRERKEDIPLLINHFISKLVLKTGKRISGLSKEAMDDLMKYHWPGNVRELMNVLEFAFVVCPEGHITSQHLPRYIYAGNPEIEQAAKEKRHLDEKTIIETLEAVNWNRSEAARRLGISRVTLWKKLKNMGSVPRRL